MNSFITKVYGFIIILLLFCTAIVLYQRNTSTSPLHTVSTETYVREESSTATDSVRKTIETVPPIVMNEATTTRETIATSIPDTPRGDIDIPLQKTLTSSTYIPCETQISYKLGRFDTEFGISKKDFLDKINKATALWNNAIGKPIFVYSENGTLTVNLIFDSRQASTIRNTNIAAEISNTQSVASQLKEEFEEMERIFNVKKDAYLAEGEAFTVKQNAYNTTVNDWNLKGGAPKAEYDALMQQKTDLQNEANTLIAKQNELNALLGEINKRINRYNELVMYANSNVAIGNSIAKKKFTEGQYIPQSEEIDIYQFTDDVKLFRVIAHEFGHALGLDHNSNEASIMNGVNNATTTVLSNDDLASLRELCNTH